MEKKKYILLCTLGASTLVVIETLIGLLRGWLAPEKWPAQTVPDEIHIVVTRGVDQREQEKFRTQWEQLLRLLNECISAWSLDATPDVYFRGIRCGRPGASRLMVGNHVYCDWADYAEVLPDIRDNDDNLSAADFIAGLVEELTKDSESVLHASIAGGRKTMSAHLQTAMMLFMRRGDSISHVVLTQDDLFEEDLTQNKYFVDEQADRLFVLSESQVLPVSRMFEQQRIRKLMKERSNEGQRPLKVLLDSIDREEAGWEIEVDWDGKLVWFCGRPCKLEPLAFCQLATLAWWVKTNPGVPFPKGAPGANQDTERAAREGLTALVRYFWTQVSFSRFVPEPRGQRAPPKRPGVAPSAILSTATRLFESKAHLICEVKKAKGGCTRLLSEVAVGLRVREATSWEMLLEPPPRSRPKDSARPHPARPGGWRSGAFFNSLPAALKELCLVRDTEVLPYGTWNVNPRQLRFRSSDTVASLEQADSDAWSLICSASEGTAWHPDQLWPTE